MRIPERIMRKAPCGWVRRLCAAVLLLCLAAALAGCGTREVYAGDEDPSDTFAESMPEPADSPESGSPYDHEPVGRPVDGLPEDRHFDTLKELLDDPDCYAVFDEMAFVMSRERDYTIYDDGDELVVHFVWQTPDEVDLDATREYVQMAMEKNYPLIFGLVEGIRAITEVQDPAMRILIENQNAEEIYNMRFAPIPDGGLPETLPEEENEQNG